MQDELRNDYGAIEELSVGDVGNATIDDDAGIQDLERMFQATFAAEFPA